MEPTEAIYVEETFVNKTDNYLVNSNGYYESYFKTSYELYKFCKKEYGKCISKVYVDIPDGTADTIGWVFEKKQKYERSNEHYIQQVWVCWKLCKKEIK
jgi:hypothetical protein